MAKRIVDLSMPLENEVKSDPEMFRPHIEYFGHKETFDQLNAFFPVLSLKICRTAKLGRLSGSI